MRFPDVAMIVWTHDGEWLCEIAGDTSFKYLNDSTSDWSEVDRYVLFVKNFTFRSVNLQKDENLQIEILFTGKTAAER